MMSLGSEGVYLHEKCGTSPSGYLPGSKTATNTKQIYRLWVSRGFRGKDYIYELFDLKLDVPRAQLLWLSHPYGFDIIQVRTVSAANKKCSSNLAYAQIFFDLLGT